MNQKYARMDAGGTVMETYKPPEGFKLTDCFHPTVASQFVACPTEVEVRWTLNGTTWMPPVETTTN